MFHIKRVVLCLIFFAIFLFITPLILNPVSADYSCNNQSISGNLNVSGTVSINHCSIAGNVTITNGLAIINNGTQIAGNVTTSNATLELQNSTVSGSVSVTVASGDNIIKNNTVTGNVTVNGGTLRVSYNTIGQNLSAPCPTQVLEAQGNSVGGTTNLCGGGPTATPTPTPTSGAIAATPTPTGIVSGPTLTPTPGQWYKISNSSFYKYGDLVNQIPASVSKFLSSDADDTGERLFIVNDGGVVAASGSNIYFGEAAGQNFASTRGWKIVNYPKSTHITPSKFLEYVKSRKQYVTVNSINDIQKNKINVITGNPVISSNGIAAQSPFVLIADGDVTIDVGQQFNPAKKSLAIMATGATTFNINSTVEEIDGIFIGKSVNFVSNISSTSNPLKINGNLTVANDSGSIVDTTYKRNRVDQTSPSIFNALYVQYYIELLPLLSTHVYEWTELKP